METNFLQTGRQVDTRLRVSALVGCFALVAAAAGPVYGQSSSAPAARLKTPQPLTPEDRPIVSRGVAPDFGAFDAPRPVAPPNWQLGGAQMPPTEAMPVRPRSQAVEPVKRASLFESAWSGMKELVVGKPAPPQPFMMSQPVTTFQQPTTARPTYSNKPGVYAGPPAYRWYGWGSTTPGSNPYAPTGQYPRGSANWYTQTGATPGAFPVPVTNPFRPAASVEPPAYVAAPRPNNEYEYRPTHWANNPNPTVKKQPLLPAPVTIPTVSLPPSTARGASPSDDRESGPQPIAQTPPPAPPPVVTMTYPAETPVPLAATSAPATPPAQKGLVETRANGLVWQAAGTTPTPFSSIGTPKPQPAPVQPTAAVMPRIEEQRAKPTTLETTIRATCQGRATVVDVKQTGPTTIAVRVNAATKDAARAAFEALSANPQLRAYKIDFEANVATR